MVDIVDIATSLGCKMKNDLSIDLENITLVEVKDFLRSNKFIESKVRKGRWIKDSLILQLDEEAGFLYVPSI